MFKRSDYIIISITCFFLGLSIVSLFYAGKEYKKVIQPQNNEVIAIEVAKLTKTNADLRREAEDLTHDLDIYKNSAESSKSASEKYASDLSRLSIINGSASTSGQGIILEIDGRLNAPQAIDLINAIKNIGAEIISVNDVRLTLKTDIRQLSNQPKLEIKVLGNSKLLKSAMERKGGIIEQITGKDVHISVLESPDVEIMAGISLELRYAKIVNEEQ